MAEPVPPSAGCPTGTHPLTLPDGTITCIADVVQGKPIQSALPDILKWGVAIVVIGGVAEWLYTVSPATSYGFIGIVLMGFATVGGRLDAVNTFFKDVGLVAK